MSIDTVIEYIYSIVEDIFYRFLLSIVLYIYESLN